MADVFISYKHEDRSQIDAIVEVLVDLQLDVWFDAAINVGEVWSARIEREARAAKSILVCWSPTAPTSKWVMTEARIGLERGVLVQCQLAACDPGPAFNDVQAADLRTWTRSPGDPEFQKILVRLSALTGRANLAENGRLRAGGQHAELVAMLRSLLVQLARAGGIPISYVEAERLLKQHAAAERIDIGEFDQNSLWGALDSIAEQNRRAREPPLFALVVSPQRGGMPGRGYYQKHVFLAGSHDALERQVFERHLARVRQYSWPRDP